MQAWELFLGNLEKKLGKKVVDGWLRPLKIVKFDACNLYLEAENVFQISWFEEHIRPIAKQHFCNNNSHQIQIHFLGGKPGRKREEEKNVPLTPPIEILSDPIDPGQTFSNFLFDQKNNLIVQFFKHLSIGAYNPVFLYGPQGIGKTHLLQACANKLKAQGLSVFFVRAETFTEHVVKAIRSSQMTLFRNVYRNQDVLIIDDAHDFSRKTSTQEELFHTFNALHTMEKQLIFCSHLPPQRLEEIEPRLISRFEWGIVLKLEPLSSTKMHQVLKNRARLFHFPLNDPLVEYLVTHFPSSMKYQMRALEALMLRHKSSTPLSLGEVEKLLEDLLNEEKKLKITPEKILSTTAAYFGIRREDILSKSHTQECVVPRKLAMFLIRKHLRLSYLAIGRVFERDHSTVMTNIRQIEKNLDKDTLSTSLEEIETQLQKSSDT
jgi:chromosomal replication initiator protein